MSESLRREFELTLEQLDKLRAASRPVPYMIFGGMAPRSPQENANDAWAALGRELGFKYQTVRPVPGKDERFFTADVEGRNE